MLAHLDEDVVFLVYGVGGIGKTELVYRLMAEVRERPEWRDAIPVHLELRAGETTTRALAELLATIGAPPEPRSGQPTEVAHLTEQLALLARVLDERPHLVFLDDVHHLPPEPVAEALAHFSRHVRRSRIFVASRREIRLRPGAEPPIVTTLGPLDAEAAAEMMEALAMRLQVERPEPSVLMRSTHGSPFHIRRLLVGSAGDDALARSLDDLGATARRALVLAAVAPLRPAVRVLSGLLGSQRADAEMHADEATTHESLRELERRFLADVKDGRLVVHDLVREELLRTIDDGELRAGRLDAAACCIAELERGGSLLHAVDAIGLAIAAGRPEQAWAWVERWHSKLAAAGSDHLLLEPLDRLREALPARRVGIDLWIARCLVRASLIERADDVLARVGEAYEPLERTRFFALSGEIAQRRGDLARAEACFARAIGSAPDDASRFQARLQTAIVAAYGGEGERARRVVDDALAALPDPTPAQRARGRWARTLSWLFDERFERAAEETARAREELSATGLADLTNQLAMLETLAAVGMDDMVLARAAVQRIDVAGLRRRVTSLYRAIVRHADGEPRESTAELLEAHAELAASGDGTNAYLAAHFGAAALAESGRLGEALVLSERSTELARAAGLRSFVWRSLAQRALLAAESMQTVLAHRLADEVLGSPEARPRSRANAHCAHAHAYTIEGDVSTALEHIAQARREIPGLDRARSALDVEHAAVELVGGNLDVAIACAERVTGALSERGASARADASSVARPYDAARAHLVLAASYVARARKTDLVLAEGALAAARELAERGGMLAVGVGVAIVAAALARRTHRGRAPDEVLDAALRELDPERATVYASILRAAIDGAAAAIAPGAVALLAHLGLADSVECYLVDRAGRRAATRHDVARERSRRELLVDELDGTIVARRGEVEIPGRALQCALLSVLIRARGMPVEPGALYMQVWGATEYHPLQHRNTLYVAINRLRKSLQEALPGREVVERAGGGWRIADGVDACVAVSTRPNVVSE
jgi:hypothetical protein